MRFVVTVAVLALVLPACETFEGVTAEVTIDTGEALKFSFDIDAQIQAAFGSKVIFTDPTGKQWTYSDLPDDLSTLPFTVKFDVEVPLPIIPLDPKLFDKVKPYCGDMTKSKYCEKLYGVRVSGIEYNFLSNTFPVKFKKSLLVITDAVTPVSSWDKADVNAVGIAFLPEISPEIKDGSVVKAEFAPGGEDAASDLMRSLAFNFGLAAEDANGNYTKSALLVQFDSSNPAYAKKPSGKFEMIIKVIMTFRVAPLA
jgi:hypothetical protein